MLVNCCQRKLCDFGELLVFCVHPHGSLSSWEVVVASGTHLIPDSDFFFFLKCFGVQS